MPNNLPAILFLACALAAPNALAQSALFDTIDAGNRAFARAIVNGDIDYIVGDYTSDACVIAPSTPNACGPEAIRAFWLAVIASAPKDVQIMTTAAGGDNDLAHATGTLTVTAADETVQTSRFVLVLKKVDGSWKLHLDTWTPS